MKIIITRDYDELSREAFKVMKEVLNNKSGVLGLATGSTPVGLYQLMIEDHKNNGTSYRDFKTFNLDEYVGLDESDPNSYRYFMNEQLFDHIDLPKEKTFVPKGDNEAAASAYDEAIEPVDIQILGLGQNGHIAFNEPGTPFDSRTHIVPLTENTRQANARFFESLDEVPTHAITQGIGTIMDAKKILILANGPAKAEAVKEFLFGGIDEKMPASILKTHPDVTLIIDLPAAAKLEEVL